MARQPLVLLLAMVLIGCSAPAATPPASDSVALTDGGTAQRWGDGPYGVVLIGSGLDALGPAIGDDRMTVLLPDAVSAGSLRAAISWLREEAALERVAVVAARDGSEAAFAVGSDDPALVDQLIAIDAEGSDAEVGGLGEFPKLFIASMTDVSSQERLADAAPGAWNEAAAAADQDSLLELVVGRLDERR